MTLDTLSGEALAAKSDLETLKVTSLAAFADQAAALNSSAEALIALQETMRGGIVSLSSRVQFLEDEYTKDKEYTQLLGNSGFEDADGKKADILGWDGAKYSDGYPEGLMEIVPLGSGMGPPGAVDYKFALQFSPKEGAQMEYQMSRSPKNQKTHPVMCPGTYRWRAWMKVSEDYDGQEMALHTRFLFSDGKTRAWAHNPTKGSGDGAALGAWPGERGVWEHVEAAMRITKQAKNFLFFLGYPTKGTKGKLWFTGVQAERLGGDGSC